MDELAKACRENRLGDVERLLADQENPLDPSKRDDNGWCPLHYASQHGHLRVVEYLLRKGCDPSCRTTKDYATPLHLACANDRVDVALHLLQALPHGALPRKTKDGSTPLHLACKEGNVRLVQAILERSRDGAYDLGNQQGTTPFGIAMSKVLASNSACDRAIANLLIERACGNPAREIRDFQRHFPAFNSRSSLERPIKVFAVGEPRSGKSTLLAALQSETAAGQFRALALRNVQGVDNHKVGVAPTDFTSRRMNSRVIFHDLASSRDFTHQNLIQSADDLAMSVFIICVNLSEDRNEIRAKMHFWMSFVYDQCAEFSTERNKPSVAIVGSFSDVPRLFSLIPPQRLHLEYNDMVANDAFSGRFNLLRKYSMDCRKEGSLPLSQLRSALRRHFRKVRQGNENIPIRWYILSFVLETEFPVPAVTLGDLKAKICEGTGLLVLLPQTAEELLQLCQCLEQQERVILVKPKDRGGIESTWIVHRSRQLLLHLDTALAGSPGSAELTGSPAVMTKNDLKESLSNAVRLLGFDVLVQVMEHFRICLPVTVEETTETERFYIPGLLPKEHEIPSWDPDATFCFSFAWALTPASPLEFFMPKFLKFLLLQLLTFVRSAEFESHSVWSGGICFSRHQGNMDICVMVNEKAVVLNVRCKQDHRIDCLTYRNKILEQIRDSKNKYQPQIQTKECVLPFEFTTRVTFPLEDIHNRRLTKIDVADLKKKLINGTDPRFEAMLPFFEPYVCLRKLPERHRHALVDPNSTHQLMSKEIMSALMKCFGRDIWKSLADNFVLPQEDSDPDTNSTGGSDSPEGEMILEYDYFLDCLSSISIFEGAVLSESLQGISTVTPDSQNTGSSSITSTGGSRHSNQLKPPDGASGFDSSIPWPANFSDTSSDAFSTTVGDTLPAFSPSNYSPPQVSDSEILRFVDNIHVIEVSPSGGEFECKPHQISLIVPEGTVLTSARIEIGVSLQGQFTFDRGTKPFSAIVMIRAAGGSPFKARVKLVVPHCLLPGGSPIVLQGNRHKGRLVFTESMSDTVHGGKGMISVLLSNAKRLYFCIGCKTTANTASYTNYCIVKVIPRMTDTIWHVAVCVSYFLQTCIEIVRKQYGEEFVVSAQGFRFRSSQDRDPTIGILFERFEKYQWRLSMEGVTLIKSHKVDYSDRDAAALIDIDAYPPRFKLQVNGSVATKPHLAVVLFTGVYPLYGTPDDKLEVEIELQSVIPRHRWRLSQSISSDDLSSVGSTSMLARHPSTHSRSSTGSGRVFSADMQVVHSLHDPQIVLPRQPSQFSLQSTISDDPEISRRGPHASLPYCKLVRSFQHIRKRSFSGDRPPDFGDILERHWVTITQKLSLIKVRPYLRQHHVVTKAEHHTLCGQYNPAHVELLLHVIENAADCNERIQRFIYILGMTAENIPDHHAILVELSQDRDYHTLVNLPSCAVRDDVQLGSHNTVQ